MLSGRGRNLAAIGGVVLALVAAISLFFASGQFPDESAEARRTIDCGYAQKHAAADYARREYEIAQSVDGLTVAVEKYRKSAEVAAKAESDASSCEASAQSRSDLAAQWANAHVARDQRAWAIINVTLLLVTIVVAVAAIAQSDRSFKGQLASANKQIQIAREVGENQARAFVHAERAMVKIKTLNDTKTISSIIVRAQNSGPTPATAVFGEAKIWSGTPEDAANAVSLEFDQADRLDALVKGDDEWLGFEIPQGHFEPAATVHEGGDAIATEYRRQLQRDIAAAINQTFKSPASVLYCRGRIFYRDIFKDRFETEFFFKWYGVPEEGKEIHMWPVAADLRVFHLIERRPDPEEN